jgi:hypothetical protein
LHNPRLGAGLYPIVAASVVAIGVVASAFIASLGALLYGTDDDRAFPYILLPVAAFTLLGWTVLLSVFLWSRRSKSGGASALWLLGGAVALPVAAQAAVQLAFVLAGNFHHYPDCPPQHLGPC